MARFRSELAVLLSFLLTLAVIMNAFYHKKQFYPSVVYLTKSNSSMAILYLQAFVFALLVGKLMNKIFFGQLRAIEMEHLFERSWYAITETCLAFTVFRDDFSPKFVTMFTLLLFLKCFHWLAEDRVDYMERSPVITLMFHLRIIGLMILLMVLDLNFVYIAYNHTISKGASVQLVFGFEYAILFVNILSTFIKYLLHTIDLQNENPWENKGIYMLYGDLILGFTRVILYLTFMSLMIKIHTFPLFAIRPMYLSLRSFKKSLNDVIMSRRAIRNLNIMYPDVTPEQLRNYSDTICIICREEMSSQNGNNDSIQQIKKLPCDHIFHKSCLRSWFQRQQTCPTCRTSILRLNTPHTHHQNVNVGQNAQMNQQGQQNVNPAPNAAAGGPGASAGPSTPVSPSSTGQQPTSSMSDHAQQQQQQQQQNNPFSSNRLFFNQPDLLNSFLNQPNFPGFGAASFPLPPFAFMPPPLPPLNLSPTLTNEELAEIEGNERHSVEARIHCLRNISTLLNASMINMQQYMNICAATSHLENITQTRNTSYKIENDLKLLKETDPLAKASTDLKQDIDSKLTPSTSASESLSSSTITKNLFDALKDDAKPEEDTTVSTTTTTTTNSTDEQLDKEADAIRQRRLEHFQTAATSSNSQ